MRIGLITSPHLNHGSYHVSPRDDDSITKWAQTFVPMGLLSIAEAAQGADIGILDWNKAINSRRVPLSEEFYEATAEWLLESSPDLIGFMTECDSYHHLIQVCRRLRARKPDLILLLGGVYATATRARTMETFREVDFVLRGEGEIAFPQFLQALEGKRPFSEVGNLSYRRDGNVVHNKELPLLDDLDDLPFPNLDRVPDLAGDDAIWVEIGRGCPFKCNFCVTAPYWKRRHRIKSPERLIRELRYFTEYTGRNDFNFTHDLFTTDRRWVLKFCKALVDAGVDASWTCSSRTDTLDEEQIFWMKRAGCRDIYFGIEAGTEAMQDRIDKNLSLDEARSIVRATLDAGIGATLGFIVGLPTENSDTLHGTLEQAHDFLIAGQTTVHLFGFCPLRGSGHFEEILPSLIFDSHFRDFPLPPATHGQNIALIQEHFDIFTRYSRLQSYGDVSVDVIRAAEEYMPILNALRDVVHTVVARGVDPLSLLTEWTTWIQQRNHARSYDDTRRYYGSIRDYIDFLSAYCAEAEMLDAPLREALQWENLRDEIRAREATLHKPVPPDLPADTLMINSSVTVARFDHVSELFPEWTGQQNGDFAFYQQSNGEGKIVWLSPVASLILRLAREGVTGDALEQLFLRSHDREIALQPDDVVKGVTDLTNLELLWGQASSAAFRAAEQPGLQ